MCAIPIQPSAFRFEKEKNVFFFFWALRAVLCGGSKNLFLRLDLLLPFFRYDYGTLSPWGWNLEKKKRPTANTYIFVSSLSFFNPEGVFIGGNWWTLIFQQYYRFGSEAAELQALFFLSSAGVIISSLSFEITS